MGNNIFIMGKAGAGKDTIAEILEKRYEFQPFTLANYIRAEYHKYFPDRNPRLDRDKLIEIGEAYKKIYGQDVWVRLLAQDIKWCLEYDPHRDIVITDGRHRVEYDHFVTQEGYIPLRVDCPDEIRFQRLLGRDGTLQGEALKKECQELWKCDAYMLDNSGDMADLLRNIEKLMRLLGRA